jgi:hypothetical protein
MRSIDEDLARILSTDDTVETPTDDLFNKAVELKGSEFSRIFENSVRSHQGFSGSAPKLNKTEVGS